MFQMVYEKKPVTLSGHWYVKLYGPDGNLKQEADGKNVICTGGLEYLTRFLASAAAGATAWDMKYVAIGTDSTSESAANTTLGIEAARNTGTVSYVSGAIYRVTATFPAGTGTGAIVEYGLFSSSVAGTMMNRDVEAVVNKGAGDILVVTSEITLS